MLHIDSYRAEADGVEFDDLAAVSDVDRNRLAARGVVYCTEFDANGRTYGGTIIAKDMEMAERVAFGRGLGEKVLGRLVQAGTMP